ncbi:MAG: glycosyltransferase family 2 protein [Brumimicrobium sp.]|nr:glycosyltransferase family 2 protein [Brumimicrobium sp.]
MQSSIVVSIIIPCYNHGKYIEETLESIERSKDKYSVEIIIVNDGSTDEFTIQKLKEIEEKGYFVLNQENQGLGKTRNNGIKLAKGKYVLPLDSDNKVCSPYLNEAVDMLEKNEQIDIIYGNAQYIGEKKGIWKNQKLDRKRLLFANQIDACAIFRKSVWEEVGGYAEDMPYMGCEDWNFWLRALNKNKSFYYLENVCFEYRVLSESMIHSISDDFNSKIFSYNTMDLYDLYNRSMREDHDKFHNIFHGGLLRKITKLILNHFGCYKY